MASAIVGTPDLFPGSQSYLNLLSASLLDAAEPDGDDDPRALLRQVRRCRMMSSDFDEELDCALRALEIYETQGDSKGRATALCAVADAHSAVGGLAEALSAASEALRLCRESMDRMGEAAALVMLAKVHLLHIRLETVSALVREFVPLCRDLGATWGETAVLLSVADWRVAAARKGPSQARREAAERLQHARDQSQRWRIALELLVMIVAELSLGNTKEARRALEVLREALLLSRALGVVWTEDLVEMEVVVSPLSAGNVEETSAELAQRAGSAKQRENRSQEAAARILLARHLVASSPAKESSEEAFRESQEAAVLCAGAGIKEGEAAALGLQAEACRRLDRPVGECSELATRALRIFKDLVHRRGEARMLHLVAATLLAKKELRPAKGVSRTALALVRQLGDRHAEAAILLDLVRIAILEGDYAEALRIGEDAGRLFCEIDDRAGSTAVLNVLAPVYLHQDNPDAARRSARDVLADLQKLGDKPGQIEALKTLAKAQLRCADAKAALASADAAIALSNELGVGAEACEEELTGTIVQAHMECGNHQQALSVGKVAKGRLAESADSGSRQEEAALAATLAKAQLAAGDLDAGLTSAQQALDLYHEMSERQEEKSILETMMEIHLQRQEFREAMSVAKQAVSLFKNAGEHQEEERAQALVARVHIAKSEPTRAVRIAREAQQKLRDMGDIDGDASLLKVIVDAYLQKEEPAIDEALRIAGEAIAVFNAAGSAGGKADAYQSLARAQHASANLDEALSSAREACKFYRQAGNRKEELLALRAIVSNNFIPRSIRGSPEHARLLKDAILLCQDCEDTQTEVRTLDALLRFYLEQQQPEEVIAVATKGLRSLNARGEQAEGVQLLVKLAEAHQGLEEYKAAISKAKEALALLEEVASKGSLGVDDVQQARHAMTSILISALSSSGDMQKAMEVADSALKKCREAGDRAGEAAMLQAQMAAHLSHGSKDSLAAGLKLAKQAQTLCQELGDASREAAVLQSSTEMLLKQEEVKEAKKAGKEALALYLQLNDKDGQAGTHRLLAMVFMKEKQHGDTQSSALEALRLWKELGRQQEEVKAVQLLVEARLQAQQVPDALRAAKEAQARFRDLGYAKGEASSWELAAQAHMSMEAPKSAQLALKNAIALHKKVKDRRSEAKTLNIASSALVMSEDVEDAIRAAKDAKAIYAELGDKRGEAESSEALCAAHAAHGDGELAIKIGREAAAGYAVVKRPQNQATALQSVASLHLQMEDLSQAAWTAHEAASLFRSASDKSGEAWALHTAAEAHLASLQKALESGHRMGSTEAAYDAIQALKAAKPLFKQSLDVRGEQACLYAWARACLLRGEAREGARHAEEMLRIAERSGEKQNQAVARLLAANCYLQSESYNSAGRKAEEAAAIFEETGDQEGLNAANGVVQQVAEVTASRGPQGRRDAKSLFQRKAFPWNHAQAETQTRQGIDVP